MTNTFVELFTVSNFVNVG